MNKKKIKTKEQDFNATKNGYTKLPGKKSEVGIIRTNRGLDVTIQKITNRQLDLFETCTNEEAITDNEVFNDAKFSKLCYTFEELLYNHSEKDEHNTNYMMGDLPSEEIKRVGYTFFGKTQACAMIKTNITEIAKNYHGKEYLSGRDIREVKNILNDYAKMKFPYIRREGEVVERGYETYFNVRTRENIKMKKGQEHEIIVDLMPVFFCHINNSFNKRPELLNFKTRIIYKELTGKDLRNDNIIQFVNLLVCGQHLPNGIYKRKAKDLYEIFTPYYFKRRELKHCERIILLYAEIAKRLGIIENYTEPEPGENGDLIYSFKIVPSRKIGKLAEKNE